MTEQEWLASSDPAAMIQHAQFHGYGLGKPLASDRKLRLWVEACHSVAVPGGKFSHAMGLTVSAYDWSHHNGWEKEVPHAVRCNILRHIIGSPFRPVLSRPCGECGGDGEIKGVRYHCHEPHCSETYKMRGCQCDCEDCSGPIPRIKCGECSGLGYLALSPPTVDGTGHLPAWPTPVRELAESLYNGKDCAFALHDELMDAGYLELADHFNPVENGPGVCLWHPKGCAWLDAIRGEQ